jgi:hypothetical protein
MSTKPIFSPFQEFMWNLFLATYDMNQSITNENFMNAINILQTGTLDLSSFDHQLFKELKCKRWTDEQIEMIYSIINNNPNYLYQYNKYIEYTNYKCQKYSSGEIPVSFELFMQL